MKKTFPIRRHKTGPNVAGRQYKEHKTTPGSPGANTVDNSTKPTGLNKVAAAFMRFITIK